MKRITHIQQQRDRAQELKAQVCGLMGCTEMEYCEYQFKVGKQYVQSYMPNYPVMIDELIGNKIYWNWWRNAWMQRDELFVEAAQGLHKIAIWQLYSEVHNYRALINELFPDFKLILKY